MTILGGSRSFRKRKDAPPAESTFALCGAYAGMVGVIFVDAARPVFAPSANEPYASIGTPADNTKTMKVFHFNKKDTKIFAYVQHLLYLCALKIKQNEIFKSRTMHNHFFPAATCCILMGLLLTGCNQNKTATWQPVGDRIKTEWASEVNPENVLPEYPRPQLQREEWQNMNGLWQYAITDKGLPQPTEWQGEILVPFAVESSLSGVGKEVGAEQELWYRRTFRVPSTWRGRRVKMNFGAVDWQATVYINGIAVGQHTGGYAPFSVDITPYLHKRGAQEVTVRVYDPTDKGYQPTGKQVENPRSIWYTSVTGIWQTVWMEPVEANSIVRVQTVPDIDKGVLAVTAVTEEERDGDLVRVELKKDGKTVVTGKGRARQAVLLTVKDMQLWSPEQPELYDLCVRLEREGKTIDKVRSYAAMRKISRAQDAEGKWRMQLNNRTYFQYGPLDQGWWPDGLYTAPTDEALVYDIQKTKDLGFNMIRKHVKVEPDRWYYHCDRLGMLVWQDMPSGDLGNEWEPREMRGGTDRARTAESRKDYYQEWEEIMDFCSPHPCVVVWVPFNEAWGQFETEKVVAWTQEKDPSRLVNQSSGGNFRDCGDIFDLHHYPQPEMYLFDEARVNVLGEYGGIGLPVEGHLWWNQRNWGYIRFSNTEEVTAEYVKYAQQLEELVKKGFSAAVYTQTTDVEGEVNGLMTYDRKVMKVEEEVVRAANLRVRAVGSESEKTESGIDPQKFQDTVDGHRTGLYTLRNTNGMEVTITNFGGRIVSILVPDKDGKKRDVVLGFDNIRDYETIPSDFGACIGRYANRIANGQITLDGQTYQLETNNFGHTLHGGPKGWQYRVYQAEQADAKTLTLKLISEDGDNGFPGRVKAGCTYTLTEDNTLRMEYFGATNAVTVINMTNHTYFNLTGDGGKDILGHLLWLNARETTPIDATFMTTGEVREIEKGSAFDFLSAPKAVGQDIDQEDEQLTNGHGYDHNWILQASQQGLTKAATLYCPETGIEVEVRTSEPGIQVYTGNFLDGSVTGKRGEVYGHRHAICLETQKYPDTPNKPEWPTAVLRPGERYQSTTEFHFSVK